jgi:hypothetical protein
MTAAWVTCSGMHVYRALKAVPGPTCTDSVLSCSEMDAPDLLGRLLALPMTGSTL